VKIPATGISLLLGFFFIVLPGKAQVVLTQWNFNGSSSASVPGGNTSPTPSTGSGTLQLIGLVTASFSTGVGSSDPSAVSPPNFGWQTTGYPASGNPLTAGITISVSTSGYNSIRLAFDQRLSSTSANTWVVYYTTDITATTVTWQQAQVFTFTPTSTSGDAWYNQRTVDFSGVAGLNDDPNAAFKIVSNYDPTVGNYVASGAGKTYAGGTSRFDMVMVTGVADAAPNTAPTASPNALTGNFNVGDTLHASYLYTDADGDPEGASLYQWYRADDASGTNATAIGGANALLYIPVTDDLNKFIAFGVTPVAQSGVSPGTEARTSWMGPVAQSLEILLYPQPFDLSQGNYHLEGWSPASAPGTYPPNMTFQQFNAEPVSKNTAPNSLWTCSYALSSKSRMLGLDAGGIGFLNTGSAQDNTTCGNGSKAGGYVGAAVLAINTTGMSNLMLGWTVSMEVQGDGTPAREYRLMPQYKIAGTATWTDFGSAYEFTSANATAGIGVSDSLFLPAVLEDLPSVMIRWIYYEIANGASGSRPEIRLDDIRVVAPGAPNAAPVASGLTIAGLPFTSQHLTGTYLYSDGENDVQGQSIIQWLRADDAAGTNTAVISGANTLSYSLTALDIGKYMAFSVEPVALTGTSPGVAVTSAYTGPVLDFADPSVLTINEVYSRGSGTNADDDLKSDWVEFYNAGTKDATVAGLKFCDSDHCFVFSLDVAPALTVPAGGFLALAQNDVNSFTFGLSSDGEFVTLRRSDNLVRIDSVNFPALDVTQSYGRYFDGTARLTTLVPPTKGKSNDSAVPVSTTTGVVSRPTQTMVYPVPTTGAFTVVSQEGHNLQRVAVYSLTGQEIDVVMTSGTTARVFMTTAKSGFYLLRIAYEDGSQEVRKIIKQDP
jgi:hypothetical protein